MKKAILILLVILPLLFSACTPAVDPSATLPPLSVTPRPTPDATAVPDPTPTPVPVQDPTDTVDFNGDGELNYADVRTAKTMDGAVRVIEAMLADSHAHNRWIVRDWYYYKGERIEDVRWLFVTNDEGETMDILIGDAAFIETLFEDHENNLFPLRQLERTNYQKAMKMHASSTLLASIQYAEPYDPQTPFLVMFCGDGLLELDLRVWMDQAETLEKNIGTYFCNHGELAIDYKRRENYPKPDWNIDSGEYGEYRLYFPADSLEGEANAIRQRLTDSGYDYQIEVKEEITLGGETFPVTWLHAVNRDLEWVDVLLTDHAEDLYHITSLHDEFQALRKPENDALTLNVGADSSHRVTWTVLDRMEDGYGYFMMGSLFAMYDAGVNLSGNAWNPEKNEHSLYLGSREAVLFHTIPEVFLNWDVERKED